MSVFMLRDDFEAIGLAKGMREVAFEDAWARFATFDGSAREFFEAMKEECPHYFSAPATDTVEHAAFCSVEAQGAFVREHGEAALRDLLKTEGLTPGRVKKAAAVDPADKIKGENNPYSDSYRGTPAEREARISSLIRQGGTRLASQLAKAAGKTITGQKLQPTGTARVQR